jgi:hypothetical protein
MTASALCPRRTLPALAFPWNLARGQAAVVLHHDSPNHIHEVIVHVILWGFYDEAAGRVGVGHRRSSSATGIQTRNDTRQRSAGQ